ncbi:hypothetical protein C365_04208 [Cryptococcus neoformans Bt85]|nr:hypothetical protein C365_04208 [Cryptococcus neoformans var. grubii Bt85]
MLLELEVSKYMADKHDSPTVSHGKVPTTTPNSSTLAHPPACRPLQPRDAPGHGA